MLSAPVRKVEYPVPNIKSELVEDSPDCEQLKILNIFHHQSGIKEEAPDEQNFTESSSSQSSKRGPCPENFDQLAVKTAIVTPDGRYTCFKKSTKRAHDTRSLARDTNPIVPIDESESNATETSSVVLTCEICSTVFFSTESLEEHVIEIHVVDKEFDCSSCEKSFICQEKLDEHLLEHEVHKECPNPTSCPICGKPFRMKSRLQQHLRSHEVRERDQLHRCKSCSKCFTLSKQLTAHQLNEHSADKPYKCPRCSKSYSSSFIMQHHLSNHSDSETEEIEQQSPYVKLCHICGKVCNNQGTLRLHLLYHESIKPFKCGLCSKSYLHRWELKDHFRSHPNAKNQVCV